MASAQGKLVLMATSSGIYTHSLSISSLCQAEILFCVAGREFQVCSSCPPTEFGTDRQSWLGNLPLLVHHINNLQFIFCISQNGFSAHSRPIDCRALMEARAATPPFSDGKEGVATALCVNKETVVLALSMNVVVSSHG